jgi:hypothetical protein
MSLNTYEIVLFHVDGDPQTSTHRIQAHCAADALFEFDFNVCQKSGVLKEGKIVPSSRVQAVRSVDAQDYPYDRR